MALLINWLIDAILILTIAYLFPAISVENFWVGLIAAVVISLLNALLRPLLILLTLPINILTLGLFTLVINTAIIMLADYIIPGLSILNFWWALLMAVLLGLANGLISQYREKR